MTPAVIREQPDGTKAGECWLCGQHISENLHVEPLPTPDDRARFEKTHKVGSQP